MQRLHSPAFASGHGRIAMVMPEPNDNAWLIVNHALSILS